MLLVGLTGGIGAGKSTVAGLLAERGAFVIDADTIVHELYQPGTHVYEMIVERFGRGIVRPNRQLDRVRIAEIVFADEEARAALNAIVHPEVMRIIAERIAELADSDQVVVLDVPLLVEVGGGEGLDLIVVVEAEEHQRVSRLVKDRGMRAEDVRARISTQATPEERAALADVIIHNDGDEAELRKQVDALWERIESARRLP